MATPRQTPPITRLEPAAPSPARPLRDPREGSLRLKHSLDRLGAAVAIVVSAPLLLIAALYVKRSGAERVLVRERRIDRDGRSFQLLAFPPLPILRRWSIDQLPQLFNILRGEMSFVGPRPLRTVVVRDFLEILPQWAERHRVRPGIAGLSQVIGGYYTTPLQKLRFDRVYIRHRGVAFDLKILLAAFAIAFWLRWQKDWDGRLPRHWLRTGSRPASVGVARVPTQRRSGARWQAAK
jgi:lipopolysaccharide/colanic/teichoic acid biosynthesis glycosyltransferase